MIPICPDHDRLMLDLALGKLEDRYADEAEATRHSCPTCRQWWESTLQGESAAELEAVVDQVFAEFQPPRTKDLLEWLPVVMAAVLALAVGLVLQSDAPGTHDEGISAPVSTVLAEEFFEIDTETEGSMDRVVNSFGVGEEESGVNANLTVEDDSLEIIGESLESGSLAGWSSHG